MGGGNAATRILKKLLASPKTSFVVFSSLVSEGVVRS